MQEPIIGSWFVRVIKSYIHAPLSRKLLEKSSIHLSTKKIKEKENSRNILQVIFLVNEPPSIDSWAERFCTKWPPPPTCVYLSTHEFNIRHESNSHYLTTKPGLNSPFSVPVKWVSLRQVRCHEGSSCISAGFIVDLFLLGHLAELRFSSWSRWFT